MPEALTGSVVMVTGAARRVGARIARCLHAAGARIVLHYRDGAGEAERLVEELEAARPGSTLAIRAELLDTADFPDLADRIVDCFGRLDALVNNASSFYATPVGRITEADFAELVGSNLKAPLFLSQALAGHLRASRGAIVNIIDIHAERPLRDHPVYCAAKAGLAGLTRALAVDLAPDVRVNGISPGAILWPEHGDRFDAVERQRILGQVPLGRLGEPEDIARGVLFLLVQAPYITGQILNVDGGRSLAL